MARKHFWQFLVTDEGNPIENAQISIYKSGSEEPVYVYFGESGTGTNVVPQIKSSRKGYFEFWIADENDANGYPFGQKFKIAWRAIGVSSGYIDHVDVFGVGIDPVDETNPDNTLKNKAVSDALAYGWQTHMNWDIAEDGPVHGIDMVDQADTEGDSSLDPLLIPLPSYTLKNKLVNNELARRWTDHESSWFDIRVDINDNIDQADGRPRITDGPHGIQMFNASATDQDADWDTSNKLVTNHWGVNWAEAYDATITNPIFSKLDGSLDYIAPVGYTAGIDYTGLNDSSFVTRFMVESFRYTFNIQSTDWVLGGGVYEYTVTLPASYYATHPSITCWVDDRMVIPYDVQYISNTQIAFRMPVNDDMIVAMAWCEDVESN